MPHCFCSSLIIDIFYLNNLFSKSKISFWTKLSPSICQKLVCIDLSHMFTHFCSAKLSRKCPSLRKFLPRYIYHSKKILQIDLISLCFHIRIKVIKALGCQFYWILQNIPLQKEWQRLRGLVKWSAIDHWQDLCQVRTVTLYAIFPPIYNLMLLLQNLLETFCKQGIEANAVFFGNPSWSLV